MSKGVHGSDLRIALLTEGEFFGETDLVSDKPSDVTVRTITPCVLLTLSRKDLDAVLAEMPNLSDEFKKAIAEHLELRSTVNRYGERNIDLVSGFAENVEIPETFVDYSANPREYSLSAVQTVVRVHTRVSDLYNGPYDQLEEQMRLTIEGIKERQEWEIINSKKFGLIHSVDPAMRISTRYGAPTPDDLDELLGAGLEEAGVLPGASEGDRRLRAGMHLARRAAGDDQSVRHAGHHLARRAAGALRQARREEPLLSRTSGSARRASCCCASARRDQGVVGLHQAGIPGEIKPSLSARLMGLDSLGVASYLLTLYFSCAVLTDDALGILENVEVGYYHDYEHRKPDPEIAQPEA